MQETNQNKNQDREQYKRLVNFLGSAAIVLIEWALFYYVWQKYYNARMIEPFWRRGRWLVAGEYIVLVLFFHWMYGGLKVGIYRFWTLVYSHMISLVIINVFFYVQVVLFDKRMHNPTAFIVLTVIDFVIVMAWAFIYGRVYRKLFPKRHLLCVQGQYPMDMLFKLIKRRDDKFDITKTVSIDEGVDKIMDMAEEYDGVLIGDLPSIVRNDLLKQCYSRNIRSYTVPKVSDILLRSSEEFNIFDAPLYLSRNYGGLAWDQQVIKRIEDIIVSGALLIITSPLFLIFSIAIKMTDGGPVFYTQDRLTKDGKVFKIYKFRTMVVDAEQKSGPVKAEENDPRILPIGRFLRATRLDELPQFINILKGDMSMVGPRPERPELAEVITKHIPEFEFRLKVKAGLTGYAQIYGRYCTTSYEKLKLDLTYICNYSILQDLKLIIMTPKVLFMKEATEGFVEGEWEDPALRDVKE